MGIFDWLFGKKKVAEQEPTPAQTGRRPDVSRVAAKPKKEAPDSPESWAQKLKERKDYRALAAVNNSTDYSKVATLGTKLDRITSGV